VQLQYVSRFAYFNNDRWQFQLKERISLKICENNSPRSPDRVELEQIGGVLRKANMV
jgi:hypothetical protein